MAACIVIYLYKGNFHKEDKTYWQLIFSCSPVAYVQIQEGQVIPTSASREQELHTTPSLA